jgi:hypothetical protein
MPRQRSQRLAGVEDVTGLPRYGLASPDPLITADTQLDLSGVPDPIRPSWLRTLHPSSRPDRLLMIPHVRQRWSSEDGQDRPLCQLDSGHLLNIYRGLQMLAPQYKRAYLDALWPLHVNGEQAELDFELAMSQAEGEDPEHFVRPLIELIERTLKCRRYLTQRERRQAEQRARHHHTEGEAVWTDGFGRQVRCRSCGVEYFIDDPMDEPDDERAHQFGHGV